METTHTSLELFGQTPEYWETWESSPGKFEGESALCEWLYRASLEWGNESISFGEFSDEWAEGFVLDSETLAQMPPRVLADVDGAYGAILSGDSQGFVYLSTFDTQAEYDAEMERLEQVSDECYSEQDDN